MYKVFVVPGSHHWNLKAKKGAVHVRQDLSVEEH